MLAWPTKPTKSKSMTTHTLSLSMAFPQRMTLMQKSTWSHTPLDSTRTSMATSVFNLFITWMNALSSFKWALWPTMQCSLSKPSMSNYSLHSWWSWICGGVMLWYGVNVREFPILYVYVSVSMTHCNIFWSFYLGHSVLYVPVAWGSQESLMGRETPATARQTPPFPTAAMMDLEDSCPLPVRTFEFHLVSFQLQ